jgi:hypothetical protein
VRLVDVPAAMVCVGLLAAAGAPLAAVGERAGPVRLRVALTTSMTLPDGVRAVVMREVRDIWKSEGVEIAWEVFAPSARGLRVLVVSGSGASAEREGHHWPVAELLRDGHGEPLAVASVAAARRVLEAAGVDGEPAAMGKNRLGIVLGRAVAHEIGHYLLNTRGHARHGLMRARIDARDFADLRDGGFGLDDDAALWARTTLTRESADALRLARFVYAR